MSKMSKGSIFGLAGILLSIVGIGIEAIANESQRAEDKEELKAEILAELNAED